MKELQYDKPELFEAFIKSAQYFVRLKTQQDVWDQLGKFVMMYFPADWIAFVQRNPENTVSIHHCTMPEEAAAQFIYNNDVRTLISDVLDSGFLASQVVLTPSPSMTVFLPIVEEYQTEMVMLIGHKSADPLPNELLNIYLAIAGLAGTTCERLHNERELNRHRVHLEELVLERTTELAKTKRQNDLILHSVREGICGLDMDGRIAFVNPFAEQMLGWDQRDLIGRDAHATFHHTQKSGRTYPAEDCPVHSTLANGCTNYAVDEEFLRKDGTAFPVEFTITPIIEEDSTVGAVMVFRDITERKRADEALQESEARRKVAIAVEAERRRLFDVLETLPTMICLLTQDYHVAFSNRSFREKFGESHGRRCYEYCFGRTEPCEFCETFNILKTGQPHHWELTGPDGSVIDAYDFPFTDTDGSPMILEMDIDVTEHKRAEEALQLAGAYNRRLIEASLDPLVTIGPNGKITDVNAATEVVTGCNRGELIGTDFSNYFTEPEKARKGYQQVFAKGFVTDYPLTIRHRDGRTTDVLYNASVYKDTRGNVLGVFAAARDVTARRRVEEELAEQRRRELDRLAELEKFQRLTVGRELKMVELKKEIEVLKRENEDLKKRSV